MFFSIPFNHSHNNEKVNLSSHPYYVQLIDDLEKTKSSLDTIYANFENAVEPDLIDCCIYELNAAQIRYKFLLNCVKKIEMSF